MASATSVSIASRPGNLALLFGAELDSETERGRQLQAGIKAEHTLQLPPRDTKASDKAEAKDEKEAAEGRAIRVAAEPDTTSEHATTKPDRRGARPLADKQ